MQKNKPVILAIETSCDETAAAVIKNGNLKSNVVATQAVHAQYGGVVPELASRAHTQKLIPVVRQAMQEADVTPSELDAVAFTQGPGLLGALLVGTAFAKSVSFALDIPLIAVHHMRAHILANFIERPHPTFPLLGLTASGGHTQLILAKSPLCMEVIGETQDDAVGEAFDKIGKLMGLPYPAGSFIDRYAQQGDPQHFQFPATNVPHLNFSFSGIKTAFLYTLKEHTKKDSQFATKHRADLCASIQATLVSMLLDKLQKAVAQTGIKVIAVAGGVAANSALRNRLTQLAEQEKWSVFIPQLSYCTDNAAMIAITAHYQYLAGDFCDLQVTARPRMPL
ncbi:MAG: tRNA (adenosine(37)-N6)-threonylcarbamoyltransferase complex transferase subunit TsaD [Bacteroidota bacterium]